MYSDESILLLLFKDFCQNVYQIDFDDLALVKQDPFAIKNVKNPSSYLKKMAMTKDLSICGEITLTEEEKDFAFTNRNFFPDSLGYKHKLERDQKGRRAFYKEFIQNRCILSPHMSMREYQNSKSMVILALMQTFLSDSKTQEDLKLDLRFLKYELMYETEESYVLNMAVYFLFPNIRQEIKSVEKIYSFFATHMPKEILKIKTKLL